VVNVTLRFLTPTLPLHADQSFALYPAARAYFSYPCPYGDCDGVFDVSEPAGRTLAREKAQVAGTLTCSGLRSRDGLVRQSCGLRVNYTISSQHESAGAVTPGRRVSGE
jgi:hypothetical protein